MPQKIPLPIDPFLPAIVSSLDAAQNLVIQASPGSGKTTRVPPALLEVGCLGGKDVLVLVPRRLAAKMAALRVAEERGEDVGGIVGYRFRFENATGVKTRLTFLTEGLLLRKLMDDPELNGTACVILDEFHERHLHSDVALAHLRLLQKTRRPDLRLVVMSATLDAKAVRTFLGECPLVEVKAVQYPVTLHYLERAKDSRLEKLVEEAVGGLRTGGNGRGAIGDVLVFLPGMADILRAADALESRFGDRFLVLPLHGDLPKERQMLVFKPADRPKIILATNVAETSLTIDGVETVIDSGLHRQASHSWWSGVASLKTKPTSRASAIQRAGRAGRTAPGRCLRLYTKSDFEGRPEFDLPEIRRADLTQTVLEIKAMGDGRLSEFPWFEAPLPGLLNASCELLYNLGATVSPDLDAPLTRIGKTMTRIPVHPRLARVLIEAASRGVLAEAARLCALIAEGELEDLEALAHLEKKFVPENVRKAERQLLSCFPLVPRGEGRGEGLSVQAIPSCLLRGFSDRVAKKRPRPGAGQKPEEELVFCFGGSGTVAAVDVVREGDFFLILDVQERQGLTQNKPRVHVRSLCPISPEWLIDLETTFLSETDALEWDGKRGRVMAASRLSYGQITLSESVRDAEPGAAVTALALKSAFGWTEEQFAHLTIPDFLAALTRSGDEGEVETLITRLALIARYRPDAEIPPLDGVACGEAIIRWLDGVANAADLKGPALCGKIRAGLPFTAQSLLDRETPASVTLTGGRKIIVHYEWGKSPWIASRLQDFFGMREGPKILSGREPLTLHLLAPNGRDVQVTSDLASFWKNAYLEIRNSLARRYPRHKWPEDPFGGQ
jgi:ATP-dependent helicase HrpB